MFRLTALFGFLAVAVSNSNINQLANSNWPWLTKPGQATTPAYWQNSGSGWPSGGSSGSSGGVDPRGPGWGSNPSPSVPGPDNGGGFSGGGGWGSRRCGGTIRNSRCSPSVFEIEREMLGTAQKMTRFCSAYSDRPLREIYGVEHFKLRVRLAEFSEDDIQVRVRQRLVAVLASSCAGEYAALRVLPDVADARQALWKMDGDTLTVLFPYNITPDTEIQSRCGREFHGDPIIVPKAARGKVFARDYDMSFTDAALRQAIKRALQQLANEDNQDYIDEREGRYL